MERVEGLRLLLLGGSARFAALKTFDTMNESGDALEGIRARHQGFDDTSVVSEDGFSFGTGEMTKVGSKPSGILNAVLFGGDFNR